MTVVLPAPAGLGLVDRVQVTVFAAGPLLAQAQEPVEYREPFNTILLVTTAVLLLAYVVLVPATVALFLTHWPRRTRHATVGPGVAIVPPVYAAPPASAAAARAGAGGAQATTAAFSAVASPASSVRGAGDALLRLHVLERRVLELPGSGAPPERLAQLLREIDALQQTEFAPYASGLLVIVEASAPAGAVDPPAPPPPPDVAPGPVPDRMRVWLARFAAEGRPVPVDWAYAWYRHLPPQPGMAADHPGFAAAFARRYREAYPYGGMLLVASGEPLAVRYTPASARFGGRSVDVDTRLVDVSGQPEALRQLSTLAQWARLDLT